MLVATDVQKSFGPLKAVLPTTLSVQAGQRLVLIGPSGCGKSTLLRLLIGLIPNDGGTVVLGDEVLTPENAERIRRERLGYVIQSGGLFPHLTARENVGLLATFLGQDESAIAQRTDELGALVQLRREVLDRFPGQLSGGQRQRIALMRALFTNPDVLFLDEPLGAVDPMTRIELQSELRQVFDQIQTTVVMVTHDLAEAAFFGDEIALMRSGRVVQKGPLQALANAPAEPFVTEFLTAHRPFVPDALAGVTS